MSKPMVLGQQVFVLSGRNVVRTMVGRIEIDRSYSIQNGRRVIDPDGRCYTFLNGDRVNDPDGFTYDDTVVAARERIEAQKAKLRKALRDLAKEGRNIQTEAYRQSVESAPYKMIDLRHELDRRLRPRTRKNVSVPATHLMPGQRVYAIITPLTRPRHGYEDVFRPFKNFVLSTQVSSVSLCPNGEAAYAFTTPFELGEYFLSRKEAMKALRIHLEPGAVGRFVSDAKEKKELEKLADNSVPF